MRRLLRAQFKTSVRRRCGDVAFDEECTIPFVARYRKERTGGMDEVVLRNLKERYEYLGELESTRSKYLKAIHERCQTDPALKAKWPTLEAALQTAATKQALEDIYLPFKPKRKTRATVAKELGLGPLADMLQSSQSSFASVDDAVKQFLSNLDPAAETTPGLQKMAPADMLKGASDILAETIAETATVRQSVRALSFDTGVFRMKPHRRLEPVAPMQQGSPARG